MSYPSGLSEHDKKLWDIAMQWPIPARVPIHPGSETITLEPSKAHGCPMCSDGMPHTLNYQGTIVSYLKFLDEQIKGFLFPSLSKPYCFPSSESSDAIHPFKSKSTGEK